MNAYQQFTSGKTPPFMPVSVLYVLKGSEHFQKFAVLAEAIASRACAYPMVAISNNDRLPGLSLSSSLLRDLHDGIPPSGFSHIAISVDCYSLQDQLDVEREINAWQDGNEALIDSLRFRQLALNRRPFKVSNPTPSGDWLCSSAGRFLPAGQPNLFI